MNILYEIYADAYYSASQIKNKIIKTYCFEVIINGDCWGGTVRAKNWKDAEYKLKQGKIVEVTNEFLMQNIEAIQDKGTITGQLVGTQLNF